MATASKKRSTKKTSTTIKNTLTDINATLIATTEDMIETGVATGEKYQKLFSKSLKKSEPLMTKQVDIVFDTVESLVDQYQFGAQRFRKLIGWKDIKKAANKNYSSLKETVSENIESIKENATERLETVQTELNARTKFIPAPVKKMVAKETKTVKTAAKKTATKTVATAKTAAKATKAITDLKMVDGIGPKMENILKAGGIKSMAALATATPAKIDTIIEKSKSNFRAVNAKGWIAQAKKMNK